MEILFWVSISLIFYSYMFYPLLLRLLALGSRSNTIRYEFDNLPEVSVLVAACNEEAVIEGKLKSVARSNYPTGRIEILVGSDASTDRTVAITTALEGEIPGLKCYDFPVRRGKPSVINELATMAKGEIIVLTDANVIFTPDTLQNIVRHFRNPEIGLVDTNMINKGLNSGGISCQETAYISREVWIKNLESRIWGAMMGPFGGCYALRKCDYPVVPANSLVDDFYINMKILERGKKTINDLESIVYEDVLNSLSAEFRRKVRIATGNFQNLRRFRALLWPPTTGIAFAFLSHKVIRWFGPLLIIAGFFSNAVLAANEGFYLLLFAGQFFTFFLIPIFDFVLKKIGIHITLFRFVVHFISMNLALLTGMIRNLRGVNTGVWKPTPRHQG